MNEANELRKEARKLQKRLNKETIDYKATLDETLQEIGAATTKALVDVSTILGGLQAVVNKLKVEEGTLKEVIESHKKQEDKYIRQEMELENREKRVIKAEGLLEEEKKLIVNKKTHLITWESELKTKERRLGHT